MLERVTDVLRALVLETPPNVGGGLDDLWRALSAVRRVRGLDMEARRDLLDLFTNRITSYNVCYTKLLRHPTR